MKDPLSRTKLVVRHLPPSLLQSDLFQQIDDRFAGRYNWSYFRPGNISQKRQRYSRAYIDFKRPEDVFEFSEFFDGHVFVNEKGAQHKAVVEYAPSQRVPKLSAKKDGREGTILKDPDYLEFLKLIAKPAEHLPSAEIQLERKEAEQAAAAKEGPIVTPLMEYIRQKRAAESGAQGSSAIGKVNRRGAAASPSKPRSSGSKRLSEKKKYILKDGAKNSSRKAKSTLIMVPKQEDQPATSSGKEASESEIVESSVSAIPVIADSGKKKILLLKGKEREASNVPDTMSQQQGVTSEGNSRASAATKQNQRREASGRLFRSILINNESRHGQTTNAVRPQHKIQILNSENAKQLPQPTNAMPAMNGSVSNNDLNPSSSEVDRKRASEDKFTKRDLHGMSNVIEKQEKHTRNKDRPDRGVWAPLRRTDASYASDERTSFLVSHHTPLPSETIEGSLRHFGRRASNHSLKDDGSQNSSEGKPSKRSVNAHSPHEKQIWVQKPSSGS